MNGRAVCVIGTCNGTYIDNAAALRLAAHVLDCVEHHPKKPIIMLVDSAGQEPSRTCEMLGGVEAVWKTTDNLAEKLDAAIAGAATDDKRAALGKQRGGRTMALDVQQRVLAESAR